MRVAPIHICLSVVINEYRWVNVIPMFLLPHKRLAKRVFERSVWRICHQYADAMSMQWRIKVELAITFHCLDSPTTILTTAPFEITERRHSTVLCPVDHISR